MDTVLGSTSSPPQGFAFCRLLLKSHSALALHLPSMQMDRGHEQVLGKFLQSFPLLTGLPQPSLKLHLYT